MRIFPAGVSTSNLSPMWKDYTDSLVAGKDESVAFCEALRRFMRTEQPPACPRWEELNVLESYFYARKNDKLGVLIPRTKHFLLDSGAFSFMQGTGGHCDWDRYANEYCDYINRYAIEDFFELDIDNIVGIREVERLRTLIERRTNRKVIPVWHVERGKQYFLDMVKEYPYVALGSIAKVVPGKQKILPKYFPWFIQTAKQHGARVHALGYTPKDMHGMPFFSVDSTNWIYGNMTGSVCHFDHHKGVMTSTSRAGFRLRNREACVWNYNEWVKYMNYAERYL